MGWSKQIPNGVICNAELVCLKIRNEQYKILKIEPQIITNIGTGLINIGTGCNIFYNLINKNNNYFNVNQHKKIECFIYLYPEFYIVGYNATIQGSLISEKSILAQTSIPNPLYFQNSLCFFASYGKVATTIKWVYQSKESINQKMPQQYISFKLAVLLK